MDMERERDQQEADMQEEMDGLRVNLRTLSRCLHRVEERQRQRNQPVEVVDLTADDNVLDELIVVHQEREEIVVPKSPWGTLVEIAEDGRSTPQIIGEVERRFEAMEGRGHVQGQWDNEVDLLVALGIPLPGNEDAPEYVPSYGHLF